MIYKYNPDFIKDITPCLRFHLTTNPLDLRTETIMENIAIHFLIGAAVTEKQVGHISGTSTFSTYRTTHPLFHGDRRTERTLLVTFMSVNLLVGNLFRFFVLKIVTRPLALENPINHLTVVDEIIKAVR